jgi:hypothetical protein
MAESSKVIHLRDSFQQEQFSVVVRRVESLWARALGVRASRVPFGYAPRSARQGEELFQSLLSQSFGESV